MDWILQKLRRRFDTTPAGCQWEICWRSGTVAVAGITCPSTRQSATVVATWQEASKTNGQGRTYRLAWALSADGNHVRLLSWAMDPVVASNLARTRFGYTPSRDDCEIVGPLLRRRGSTRRLRLGLQAARAA
jgi:hypothetical protein